MADPTQETRAKIPLKRFLADYKAGIPDREVMQKYGLSARSLITLIKTLVEKKVLDGEDLARRKQMTEQVELVKEQKFLKGLFICPNCGHPHPQQFDICPACGANPGDYTQPEQIVEDVTTTGGHFYVDDTTTVVGEDQAPLTMPEPVGQAQRKPEDSPDSVTPPDPHAEDADTTLRLEEPESEAPKEPGENASENAEAPEPPQEQKTAPKPAGDVPPAEKPLDEPKEKSSPFKSVRALISKIRKT
jgi:hypothetical protein